MTPTTYSCLYTSACTSSTYACVLGDCAGYSYKCCSTANCNAITVLGNSASSSPSSTISCNVGFFGTYTTQVTGCVQCLVNKNHYLSLFSKTIRLNNFHLRYFILKQTSTKKTSSLYFAGSLETTEYSCLSNSTCSPSTYACALGFCAGYLTKCCTPANCNTGIVSSANTHMTAIGSMALLQLTFIIISFISIQGNT